MPTLNEVRKEIDKIDLEILDLLKKRSDIVKQVGPLKSKASKNPVFIRHEREADMLNQLTENNKTALSDDDLQNIFREIISACRALEAENSVAYLGPTGTYSEIAVIRYFGHSQKILKQPQKMIEDVFAEVENKRCTYGVIPIENSFEGTVNQSMDALIQSKEATICAEINLKIEHNLVSLCDNINEIDTLFTHEQTLSQCRQWLQNQEDNWKIQEVFSNGEAARLASQTPNSGAISSHLSAEHFELNILQAGIQTKADNITRFLVLGNHRVAPSKNNQTTLVFATEHKPGSLFNILKIFSEYKINISKLQSRPSKNINWQYTFYVDIDGHISEKKVAASIEEVRSNTSMLKVLGSYPKPIGSVK